MELAILLSVAASFCTATSSVCQRLGARTVKVTGFDPWLVFRLARQPVWLLGFASMLAGFGLQVVALAGEAAGLVILVAGVVALSHSRLITGEEDAGLQKEVDGHVQAADLENSSRPSQRMTSGDLLHPDRLPE
jgi:hypothetical protein